MKEIIIEGPSIDKATDLALEKLGAGREEVAVEPLAAGSSGFLGLFGKTPAKVRVSLRDDEKILAAVFIRNLLRMMNIQSEMKVTAEDDELIVSLDENASPLIGSRGQTLDSLQYLTARFLSNDKDKDDVSKVVIDIDNYREKRLEDLKEMALKTAAEVAESKQDQRTEPLSAQERRIVHMTLKENPDVTTFSIGEGSRKRVVIATTDPEAQRKRREERDRDRDRKDGGRSRGGRNGDKGGGGGRSRGGRSGDKGGGGGGGSRGGGRGRRGGKSGGGRGRGKPRSGGGGGGDKGGS